MKVVLLVVLCILVGWVLGVLLLILLVELNDGKAFEEWPLKLAS